MMRTTLFNKWVHLGLLVIVIGAFVTFFVGERGTMHLRQGEIADFYISEGRAEKQALPFEVKLLLFDIEYHPDSDEPADYISFLKFNDQVSRVSMNKIHKQSGYRFYQMDYDRDEMGTVLMVSHDPWGIAITYTGYLLLLISLFWWLRKRMRWKHLLYAIILVAALWVYISQLNPMTPVLRSPLLAAHVSVIMVAYLLFLAIAILGIIGICSKKSRRGLDQIALYLLRPAVTFLALGIIIGAVWANISWGRYWGWDPKETWALITALVYAVPLHRNIKFLRNPQVFNCYCALAFLAVLMTFFGVSYFLGGVHSYV
ncbi:hypothetical protein AGMMS49982_17850 [Bacteroidia bacterium]|nr:hypothetical protein AGMMS49982_17850 [Bacteroidia bacterium]